MTRLSSLTRRVLWWLMTLALFIVLVSTSIQATRIVVLANKPAPADSSSARDAVVKEAQKSTAALLSYKPDTVERELTDAIELTTGEFRPKYTDLVKDVVIPGAQQNRITASARVPAAGVTSLSPTDAVLLVFINQTVAVGTEAPEDTASSVRVTMEKIDGRWLISGFDPV